MMCSSLDCTIKKGSTVDVVYYYFLYQQTAPFSLFNLHVHVFVCVSICSMMLSPPQFPPPLLSVEICSFVRGATS